MQILRKIFHTSEDFLHLRNSMNYINYNGKIVSANTPIIGAANRGLRYGDGLFETIKLKNGSLILGTAHFERLWNGMETLQFDIPKFFTPQKLEEEILQLASKNNLKTARIRLTIVRGNGGIYDPENHKPNYIMEALKLPEDNGPLNSNGLQVSFYRQAAKSIDAFSNIKSNNYLPYVMAAIFAKQQHCNDAFLLNNKGNVCDSTIANIFFIKEKTIYTPALTEGPVAGVMRGWLIKTLPTIGFNVQEKPIETEELLLADEIFLSNSIYNIRWVGSFENKNYSNNITAQIVELLLRKHAGVFC